MKGPLMALVRMTPLESLEAVAHIDAVGEIESLESRIPLLMLMRWRGSARC